MNNFARIAAASFAVMAGLGLAGLGATTVAQAEPGYHWCPGQQWDQSWGNNWEQNSCHDNHFRDNDPRDRDHWQGRGEFDPNWQQQPQR